MIAINNNIKIGKKWIWVFENINKHKQDNLKEDY